MPVAFCFAAVCAILEGKQESVDQGSLLSLEEDMECKVETNLEQCTCSYESCSRKGKCCECLHYHRRMGELPGCLFPPEAERTYDRSIAHFVRVYSRGEASRNASVS